MKLKIARREAKETNHWLKLILTYEDKNLEEERARLINECEQIKLIMSSIINKLG
jgi:four helix bundle protein